MGLWKDRKQLTPDEMQEKFGDAYTPPSVSSATHNTRCEKCGALVRAIMGECERDGCPYFVRSAGDESFDTWWEKILCTGLPQNRYEVARAAWRACRAMVLTPLSAEPYGYLWYTKNMERRFTHRIPKEGMVGDATPVYLNAAPLAPAVTGNAPPALTGREQPAVAAPSSTEGTVAPSYVPGLWRCAKCKLDLLHTNLHVYSGTTSANNEPQQCPNGCGPMWRVSEADYRKELLSQVDDLFDQLQTARSAIGQKELTFNAFREANVRRCLKWHPAGIESWSPSDWLTAVTGELGELASLLKMRNRERDGLPGNKFSPSAKQVADELADVLTYLDLLAAALNVDLGRAAVEKFNEVSERVGFPDRIIIDGTGSTTQPKWHRPTLDAVLRGLRSETDSTQLRAVIASVEAMIDANVRSMSND